MWIKLNSENTNVNNFSHIFLNFCIHNRCIKFKGNLPKHSRHKKKWFRFVNIYKVYRFFVKPVQSHFYSLIIFLSLKNKDSSNVYWGRYTVLNENGLCGNVLNYICQTFGQNSFENVIHIEKHDILNFHGNLDKQVIQVVTLLLPDHILY